MPEIAPKDVAETEKGFGTGLRAQLERRRETAAGKGGLKAANPDASGSVPAAPAIDISDADLDALRDELAASLAREEQLRGALSEQVAAHDRELSPQHDLASRQAIPGEASYCDGRRCRADFAVKTGPGTAPQKLPARP